MKYALALAAAAAFVATGALAEHHGAKPDEATKTAKMESHFKEVDANGDGQISEQELVEFVTAKAKADFAAMAGDDGLVSFDEMKAHHQAKHKMMMKDHAGMNHGDNAAGDQGDEHKDGHH